MSLGGLPAAAFFDMDGVLVNSNPFHVEKWRKFLEQRNVSFDSDELPRHILGKHNDDVFRAYFGGSLSHEEMRRLGAELEAQFRETFRQHAKPLPGVKALIGEIHAARIPMAVVSSAIRANVEFVVDVLELRSFFQFVVSGDDVRAPKPDPEIYLTASHRLRADPSACVAFEDSFTGIEAAKNAGMKCIAVASTFAAEELRRTTAADLVTTSFEELSLAAVRELFQEPAKILTGFRSGGR